MLLKLIPALLLASLLVFTSCGDDDDCDNAADLNADITEEFGEVEEAQQAYADDPSTSNCNTLREAYEEYIEELEEYQSCADELGIGEQFRIDLAEANDSLSDLNC